MKLGQEQDILEEQIMYDGPEHGYEEYEDEDEGIQLHIYVERSTNFLYEVQYFSNFVLTRPLTPGFEDVLRKLSFIEFDKEYFPFEGDPVELEKTLEGENREEPFVIYPKRR